MKRISNIIDPHSVIRTLLQLHLIPIYLEEYGEENADEISSRLESMVFLPFSNPIDTRNFIRKNYKLIGDKELLVQSEIEYIDFVKRKKYLHQKHKKRLIKKLDGMYRDATGRERELLKASYDSILSAYESQKIPTIVASEDLQFVAVNIVTKLIETISEEKAELIQTSIWGKRIQRETDYEFSSRVLANALLNDKRPISTFVTENKKGQSATICAVPLMKYADENLDIIILRELRHAVEATDTKIGTHSLEDGAYELFDGIRAEVNALYDENRIKKSNSSDSNESFCVFSRRDDNSLYPGIGFSKCTKFIIDNREKLNRIAFSEDDSLEAYFQKSLLDGLEGETGRVYTKEYFRGIMKKE